MNRLFLLFFMLATSVAANAESPFSGDKELVLKAHSGDSIVVGSVSFNHTDDKIQYTIALDEERFSNEFLSMRPFQCINQDRKMLCHLQYPYEKQGYITKTDLTDLEYDLLFLHKKAEEYGIDAWNGLYYQLAVTDKKLTGELHEVDLNVLVAPPKKGNLRPITGSMLHVADPKHHLYPQLEIR